MAGSSDRNVPWNVHQMKYTEPEELPFNFFLNHKKLIKRQNKLSLSQRKNRPMADKESESEELQFKFFEDQELRQDGKGSAWLDPGAIHSRDTEPEELQFQFFEDQEVRQDEKLSKQQNKPPCGAVPKQKHLDTSGYHKKDDPAKWVDIRRNYTNPGELRVLTGIKKG